MSEIIAAIKRSKFSLICISITFFCSGLFINLLQLSILLVIRPFSKLWFNKIMYYLVFAINARKRYLDKVQNSICTDESTIKMH